MPALRGSSAPAASEAPLALALGLLAVLLWDLSGWDWAVSAALATPQGFAARDAGWARTLLHEGLRGVDAALLLLALGQAVRAAPAPGDGPTRADHARALLALLAAWTLVPALKQLSLSSCPWSLAAFGGEAQWVSHWRIGVADGGPGHCFPSGHAAGSFGFFAQLWLWAPWRRQRSAMWRWWLLALLAGGALGSLAQVARGAHFVSHCLWSAWLCALLTWVLMLRPRRAAAQGSPSPVRA